MFILFKRDSIDCFTWRHGGNIGVPKQWCQHSLTSVERSSYLRLDFVNVWCHARLCFCFDRPLWSVWWSDGLFRGLVLLFRSSLDWFNQEDATASVWKWCFNVSPRSTLLANREGQWMLLSNIPWMAPDGMAFKKNYTNKQIKLKWTAAPSKNFFKILVGIIKNYPYGNVCLCRIIMTNNECLQQQQEQQLYFSTLHWFTWYKKNRYNYGESTGCP